MGKRKAIHALILERRAIHKSAICRELGYAWGTVGHHLSHLSKRGQTILEYHGNRLWAFAPGINEETRTSLALLGHGRRADVLDHLSQRDQATIRDLSESLEASQRVIRTHLSHLLTEGFVGRTGPPPHRYRVSERNSGDGLPPEKRLRIANPRNFFINFHLRLFR